MALLPPCIVLLLSLLSLASLSSAGNDDCTRSRRGAPADLFTFPRVGRSHRQDSAAYKYDDCDDGGLWFGPRLGKRKMGWGRRLQLGNDLDASVADDYPAFKEEHARQI